MEKVVQVFHSHEESRRPATLSGVPVFFISKMLLLLNKRAIGRAGDLADIEELGDRGPSAEETP